MKRWHSPLTREWRAKLLSLALATLLWLFIQHSIRYSPEPSLPPDAQNVPP